MSPIAVIILAAGKGTRMKSDKAKVLFKLAGKPMIERVVNTALKLNCEKVCVVVGHQKEVVMAAIPENECIVFCEQMEQLGTGHAVMMAADQFKGFSGDVFILAGDVPLLKAKTLQEMLEHHKHWQADCTILTAILPDAGKYGRIIRNDIGDITGIVEFKDATEEQKKIQEFNTGILLYKSEVLFDIIHKLKNDNAQNEYYLTDTISLLVNSGKKVSSILLHDLTEATGVNSQQQLTELEQEFLKDIKLHWLNNGVMIHNPDTVYIGEDVTIEPDVTIDSHTTIKGKCRLEKGCYIGSHCWLEDADVGREAILQGYNIVIQSNVSEHEIIPWRTTVVEDESL